MRPKVVVMCGSTRFIDVMAVCAWIIEKEENAIVMKLHLLPDWYSQKEIPHHLAEHEGVADMLNLLHLRKIDMADEIFVVNYEQYVGDDTRREIIYAQDHGVDVRFYSRDPVGVKVNQILCGNVPMAEEQTTEDCQEAEG